jgi:phosphonate transport system permease protein
MTPALDTVGAEAAVAAAPAARNGHRPVALRQVAEPAISLNRVDVSFGPVIALRGVTLRVGRGERVAVIGASGAGKSTLFAALTRSLPIRRGRVAVAGTDLMSLNARELRAARRQIGVIYQAYGLVPQLSVGMNVAAAELADLSGRATLRALFRGFDRARSERVQAALERVGLGDRMTARVADLSGGQQQRVAVARLLLQEPELVLADEPISAVDPVNGARVMGALHELADELGSTLLVSVHNVALARGFPRVVALRAGAVIFDGAPEQLDDVVLDEVYAVRSAEGLRPSPSQSPARSRSRCARPPERPGPPAAPRQVVAHGSQGPGGTASVPGVVPRPSGVLGALLLLLVIGAAGWSVQGTNFDPVELVRGAGPIERFVGQMLPPDLTAETLQITGARVLETIQMSLLGALLGGIVAVPLAMLGTAEAATVGTSRRLRLIGSIPYHLARFVLNLFRSIPDILWALVFVVALGLGPFPGTMALAVHSAGVLGKLFSETLETVPARPVDALRAIGATRSQRLLFGRLPQAAGGCVSLTMYQWECNIRSAAILGFVGAGGIGQEILVAMNLFDYPKVATLTLATILAVLLVDRLSAAARKRLVV